MKRAYFAVLLAALAGCTSAVPYEPERAIVRSIPPERARTALRRSLRRAGLTEVTVEEGFFAYEANGANTLRYAELDPHVYRWKMLEASFILVRPKGEYVGNAPELEGDLIWFPVDQAEEAAALLDALESLKAAALAGQTTP